MIWVTDADGYLIYVSPEWETLTGQSVAEARGLGWLKKVHADDRPVILGFLFEASNAKQPYILEFRLSNFSGNFAWVSSSAAPSLLPEDGKFIGYLGSVKVIVLDDALAQAAGHIGNLRTPAGVLNGVQLTAMEGIADQLMITHSLVKAANEPALLSILEVALVEVGRRLAQEQDSQARAQKDPLRSR